MAAPTPVPQTNTPRSAAPARTASQTRWATSGKSTGASLCVPKSWTSWPQDFRRSMTGPLSGNPAWSPPTASFMGGLYMGSWKPMLRPAVLMLVAACTAEAAPLPAATLPELTGSVRGTALGGATAALGADPGLAWSSPAAPAGAERALVALTGQRGFIDDLTWQAL